MASSDDFLRNQLSQLTAKSDGTLSYRVMTTRDLAQEIGVELGHSPNPIYAFDIESADGVRYRSIAYTLTLDGTRRTATRAEALGRALAAAGQALFALNPFLLIFDYVGKRFMAVPAATLFNEFMREIAIRPLSSSLSATFSLTPNFENKTVSMYATVHEPIVWLQSVEPGVLTLEVLVSGLSRIRDATSMLASRFPAIVAAIADRVRGDVQLATTPIAIEALTIPNDSERRDPEGLDENAPGSGGWGDYPLDAVFVRTELRSVSEVVKRIHNQRYVLDPDFQREFVWPSAKQSKLIESCIMRIPLPVFYVAEGGDGRIIVVDGLQRLTTFVRFLRNDLKLAGLATAEGAEKGNGLHILEGKYFDDLPLNLQERVQDTQLTMYILDAKAPERARLDIFERVNSGEPLTRQQMRNALYNGPATQWLKRGAESQEFQAATGGTLNSKTMRDREAINRFCAFKLLGPSHYTTGDMDGFLAEGLLALGRLDEVKRDDVMQAFRRTMELNMALFGEHAFRKSLAAPTAGAARSVINISLFEVCSVTLFNEATLSRAASRHDAVRGAIIKLLRNEEFATAITYSTNSTLSVRRRFAFMEKAVSEAIDS